MRFTQVNPLLIKYINPLLGTPQKVPKHTWIKYIDDIKDSGEKVLFIMDDVVNDMKKERLCVL